MENILIICLIVASIPFALGSLFVIGYFLFLLCTLIFWGSLYVVEFLWVSFSKLKGKLK